MRTQWSLALLALLGGTVTNHAIQVVHLEDSVTRTWFSVTWEAAPFAPLAFLENGPLSDAGAVDNDTFIKVDAIHPFFTDSFNINFALGSRLYSTATVAGFAGVQLLALPGNDYGVQVVYGEPVPLNGTVPDGGTTAGLLGLALSGLLCCRRRTALSVD